MKKIFIPLTLEKVGSEGKFFTDNTVLKLIFTMFLSGLAGLLVYSFFHYLLPSVILIPVIVLVCFIILYYGIRFWVLRERALFKLLQKLEQHKIINAGEFSDKESYSHNICLHAGGQMSGFIKITRGSTLGMDDKEKQNYYLCIKRLEDVLIMNGYSFKVYNCESPEVKDTIFTDQRNSCREQKIKALENNLTLKNKYTKIFMEKTLRDEEFVYCVYTLQGDLDYFRLKLEQALRCLTNEHIRDAHLMNEQEITDFVTKFFDVVYFEYESESEDDLEDILVFED